MPEFNICLDIGGTKILGAILDEKRNMVMKLKKKTRPNEGSDSVDMRITEIISELNTFIKDKGNIKAIAAGAPGIISDSGEIIYAPNLPWKNYPIKQMMEDKFNVPFYIGNDVNLGTLGEWKFGAAKGCRNVVGLFVGTGIGGGLVLNNKLFYGATFAAGEIGHIPLNPDGPYCGCGSRGCLEAYASKIAITNEIRTQIERGRPSLIAEFVKKDSLIKGSVLKKGIESKDELVEEAIERSAYYIAVALGGIANTLNPEAIVIGGGVIEAVGDFMLPVISKEVKRFTMPTIFENCKIVKAELGDNSVIYGALALIEMNRKTRHTDSANDSERANNT